MDWLSVAFELTTDDVSDDDTEEDTTLESSDEENSDEEEVDKEEDSPCASGDDGALLRLLLLIPFSVLAASGFPTFKARP
jgi:hypothetical protein